MILVVKFLEVNNYIKRFEKRYSATLFSRQESGEIHNTVEWNNRVYDCLKRNDITELLNTLNAVWIRYTPGELSADALRSAKNLAVSLISCLANFSARDRLADNELLLTAADVCIMMCEETANEQELLKCTYAGLVKISGLIQEYSNREYHHLVRHVKEYVFRHLHDEFRISDMAMEFGVSPEHLSRAFHKAEGITLKQYILEERLGRACNLLKYSDYTVSVISRYLAFPSQSRFTEVFKKKTGKTPLDYRHDFSDHYS